MFEGTRDTGQGGARRPRYLFAWAVAATVVLCFGFFSYQLWREGRILDCDAETFDELRSSLGRPDQVYEADGETCWRYSWTWGFSTWCSSDGVNVKKGWVIIE